MTREPAATALPFELTGRRVFVAGHRGFFAEQFGAQFEVFFCEIVCHLGISLRYRLLIE